MSRASPARVAALVALRRIEQRRGYSNRILSEVLEQRTDMDPRDRALATTLVYGVLRHRARLDALIDAVAHKPKKIKGELREVLRLITLEQREFQRPAAIAGSQAKALTRKLDRRGALNGLITAIVSSIDRDGEALDTANDASEDAVSALTRRWSIPGWLAERWVASLDTSTARARAVAMSLPPPVDLRVDLTRITAPEAVARLEQEHPGGDFSLVDDQPQCVRTRGAGDLFYGPMHGEGLISVQSLGSQQAARMLAARPGDRVLDACCGMGTKTLQLAESMSRRGELVAIDTDAAKLEKLAEMRERGALDSRPDFTLDARNDDARALSTAGSFDAILVDAPCSGLGDLARHPELRWRSSEADITRNAALQAEFLAALGPLLRPGGRLVYAVCSLEPEEGRDLVAAVAPAAGLRVEEIQQWSPEAHATDGFFCARLTRAD